MKQQTFIKDQSFILSAPQDYGIEPPEGKTHEDFICWHGCDPNGVNHGSTDLEKNVSAYTSMTYSNPNITPCYYPVWNMYGWTQDQLSTEFYVNGGVDAQHPGTKRNEYNDAEGINTKRNNCIHTRNNVFHLQNNYTIYEGSKIRFFILNSLGKKINNVYLNGQLFAGISVDQKYYEDNIDTLYKFNQNYLSNLVIWSVPLTATNGYKLLEFNITSCHVSSDNLMHISCDVETIGGTYNLYESLDDSI